MLGRFIRLVDYIGVQALLDRSVGSVEGFLRSLQSPNRRTGVFEISVYLEAQAAAGRRGLCGPAAAERRWGVAGDDEAVARFMPDGPQMQEIIAQMLSALVGTVDSVPRILYTNPFKAHVLAALKARSASGGPDAASAPADFVRVNDLVTRNARFSAAVASIRRRLDRDYRDAQEYALAFESVKPAFLAAPDQCGFAFPSAEEVQAAAERAARAEAAAAAEAAELPAGGAGGGSAAVGGSASGAEPSADAADGAAAKDGAPEQASSEALLQTVDAPPPGERVGAGHRQDEAAAGCGRPLHRVARAEEASRARRGRASRRLTGVLKSIAATQCSGALADFSRCVGALREQPATLRDFAGWLESCAAAHSEAASLARRTARVEDMYRLLTSYDVKVSTDAQVQLDELRRVQGCYAEETTTAEAQKHEKLSGMSAALEGQCARLRAKSEQLDQRLRRGVVEDPNEDPETVGEELAACEKALDAAEEKAATLNKYQTLMGLDQTEFGGVRQVRATYRLRSQLWDLKGRWMQLFANAMNDNFTTEVDVEALDNAVARAFKESFALDKKVGNDVSARLKKQLGDFQRLMPVVSLLGNPRMLDRHWQAIFKAVGFQGTSDAFH